MMSSSGDNMGFGSSQSARISGTISRYISAPNLLGAVAIEIKRPSHECKTYLFLKLKGIDDYRIDMGAYERMDNLGMAISAFTEDYVLRKYGNSFSLSFPYFFKKYSAASSAVQACGMPSDVKS